MILVIFGKFSLHRPLPLKLSIWVEHFICMCWWYKVLVINMSHVDKHCSCLTRPKASRRALSQNSWGWQEHPGTLPNPCSSRRDIQSYLPRFTPGWLWNILKRGNNITSQAACATTWSPSQGKSISWYSNWAFYISVCIHCAPLNSSVWKFTTSPDYFKVFFYADCSLFPSPE